jgi:tetratricopeptide (TPR) repeat protein
MPVWRVSGVSKVRESVAMRTAIFALLLAAFAAHAQTPAPAQAPAPAPQQPEFVRKAQQAARSGNLEEALAIYQAELKTSPNSTAANYGAGVTLDLLGRTREARTYFERNIELAETPAAKANARRALAMSYGFDNDCANTTKLQEMAADYFLTVPDYFRAGEMYNEAARVCIEAGALDAAEKLYRRGEEVGLKQPDIPPARVALWKFRTEHALARLAARRNQPEVAKKHVAAARALLDANPEMAKDQEIYFPYLTGYVALHTGDAKTALAELQKARQDDPFIQLLMAQAHEKLAESLYKQVAGITGHNPAAATAQPVAAKKLKR